MKLDVVNLDAKTVGSVELDASVFGVEVRRDILARMVNYQLAKRRSGNHKTKQIWEVSARPRSRTPRRAPAAPVRVRCAPPSSVAVG